MDAVYMQTNKQTKNKPRRDLCTRHASPLCTDDQPHAVTAYMSIDSFNNQTVSDGVAHSKNPRKCTYHVIFDPDLDLEHTLDAC